MASELRELKSKSLESILQIIRDNDAVIKNHLQKIYKDKPIPSKVLRNARENGITINGNKINLRSGFPTRHTFKDLTFKLSSVTRYAESLDIDPANPKKPTWTGIQRGDSNSMFKDDAENRKWRSTGVYRGEFIDNLVNRQGDANSAIDELKKLRIDGSISKAEFDAGMEGIFKRVNRYSGRRNVVGGELKYKPNNWENYGTPLDINGQPKTPDNFVTEMNRTWSERGEKLRLVRTETGGLILHQGHGVSAQQFGPNIFNVEAQPALALDLRGQLGAKGQSANIQQGERTIKSIDELRAANVATDIKEAYQHYLLDNYEGINRYGDLPEEWRVKRLHDPNWNPTAAEIEGLNARLNRGNQRLIDAANIDPNKGGPSNEILNVVRKGKRSLKNIYSKIHDIDFWKIDDLNSQSLFNIAVPTTALYNMVKGAKTMAAGIAPDVRDALNPAHAVNLAQAQTRISEGENPLTVIKEEGGESLGVLKKDVFDNAKWFSALMLASKIPGGANLAVGGAKVLANPFVGIPLLATGAYKFADTYLEEKRDGYGLTDQYADFLHSDPIENEEGETIGYEKREEVEKKKWEGNTGLKHYFANRNKNR